MQAPLAPSPAQQDDRATIARLGLLFICGVSPRSAEFAQKKLRELFGYDADEADLRAAQMQLLTEATTGITSLLRKGRRS
jgi:hypothetical protein